MRLLLVRGELHPQDLVFHLSTRFEVSQMSRKKVRDFTSRAQSPSNMTTICLRFFLPLKQARILDFLSRIETRDWLLLGLHEIPATRCCSSH
jgi:hypothetical protein